LPFAPRWALQIPLFAGHFWQKAYCFVGLAHCSA
jgi:hypothetical protein